MGALVATVKSWFRRTATWVRRVTRGKTLEATENQKRRVESAFHEALKLPPKLREEYVAKVCADDASVKRQVVSLLRHYDSADDLKKLVESHSNSEANLPLPEHIGPYQVIGRLGRGGMGEVYLVRDPTLGRKVAIKVLSPAIAVTPDAMQRLRREALAASVLSHPNILTVHEFPESDGAPYIVTEYVEGSSLRGLIGKISSELAMSYASQIGQALTAAHKAGIVHRDIKPENIMVRPDGYVKVLDFGLAKASPLPAPGATSVVERLEEASLATAPGMLIGTISYMSPEQLRGQEVDQRTDIWSWGVVLYEMLTGRRPFEGQTTSDVIAAILQQEPQFPESPVEPILRRSLSKSLQGRYQDLGQALNELDRVAASRSKTTNEHQHSHRKQLWIKRILIWTAALLALSFVVAVSLFLKPPRSHTKLLENPTRLTANGRVLKAAISPEGDYMAYAVRSDNNNQALRLLEIKTGADTERLPPGSGSYKGITFYKRSIYYVLEDHSVGTLYRVPMLKGEPKPLVVDVASAVSFCPDDRFVFLRQGPTESYLLAQDLKTGYLSTIAWLEPPNHFWSTPLCSGDGKMLISEVYSDTNGSMRLMRVRSKDGQKETMAAGSWPWMRKPIWLTRDSIMVAVGKPNVSRAELVQVFTVNGDPSAMSGDLSDYIDVDIAKDESTMVTVQADRLASIWLVPMVKGRGEPTPLTPPGSRFYWIAWMKARKLVSITESGGRQGLWTIDPATGAREPILADESLKRAPEASLDGKYLIYASNRDGTFHLWIISQDDQAQRRLTTDIYGEEDGVITPDDKWVFYTSLRNGFRSLWKIEIAGGKPAPVVANTSRRPVISRDGKLLACEYLDGASGWVTAVFNVKTAPARLVGTYPQLKEIVFEERPQWSQDSKSLLYVSTVNGVSNIWEQKINGGVPRQITHFNDEEIFSFALSPDGNTIACVRGKATSDAVLLRVVDK